MSAENLKRRIEVLQEDFKAERGTRFQHFFCPILHTDEPCEVIEGHIIPEALGGTSWVPQRKDVDNFYGWVAEADFIGIAQDRPKGLMHMLRDPVANRRHKPRLETANGETIHSYHAQDQTNVPAGHSKGRIVDGDTEQEFHLVLKKPLDDIIGPEESAGTIYLVVERDYRAAAVATAIKAAHLTCFKIFGYKYAFSYSGLSVSSILSNYFLGHRTTRDKDSLEAYFRQYYSMVLPLQSQAGHSLPFEGTLKDGLVMHCIGASGKAFAVGVIIKAGQDILAVLLPGESEAINTYFDFLKMPPQSLVVSLGPLFPIGGDPKNQIRMPLLNQSDGN